MKKRRTYLDLPAKVEKITTYSRVEGKRQLRRAAMEFLRTDHVNFAYEFACGQNSNQPKVTVREMCCEFFRPGMYLASR